MALQWAILASVVSVEAAIAIILILPLPRLLKSPVVTLASLLLKPSAGVLPFAVCQLMELYWKKEHLLICVSEVCTASERDRYEKSIYKAQRNVVLCILACLLYWCIYIICKFHKAVQELDEDEKRHKNQCEH